jgi:predicted dehydrogenase
VEHRPLGVGVVGAGTISREHLRTLTLTPEVVLRFVADPDPERAHLRAAQFGVPGWGTVEQLLADPTVDLVLDLTAAQIDTARTDPATVDA